jgi:hypothetical protein
MLDRRPFAGALFLAAAATACGGEPCSQTREVIGPATETPFSDGSTVFSKCGGCPELTNAGVDNGPATLCSVWFAESRAEASVACYYGPGGRTSTSNAFDVVSGVPNLFDYCKARCPDEDALPRATAPRLSSTTTATMRMFSRRCIRTTGWQRA